MPPIFSHFAQFPVQHFRLVDGALTFRKPFKTKWPIICVANGISSYKSIVDDTPTERHKNGQRFSRTVDLIVLGQVHGRTFDRNPHVSTICSENCQRMHTAVLCCTCPG